MTAFATLLAEIFAEKELQEKPPMLVDIGASGFLNEKWTDIAPYSLCLIADADEREMGYTESAESSYKKLYVSHSVIIDTEEERTDFYLTKSPYCSSRLRPDVENLEKWIFRDLFSVERTVTLPAKSLSVTLRDLNIAYVDWFKTDSQGTDLRLFKSLPATVVAKTLAVELEPGVLDSYLGEDKLWKVMQFMEERDFWMSTVNICGSQRIISSVEAKLPPSRTLQLKNSPGWGEVTYLAACPKNADIWERRECLLFWVFACLEKQYGVAAEIALQGKAWFGSPLFSKMEEYALAQLTSARWRKVFAKLASRVRKCADWLDRQSAKV